MNFVMDSSIQKSKPFLSETIPFSVAFILERL